MTRTIRRRFGAAVATAVLLVLTACGGAEGDQVASAGGEQDASGPATENSPPLDPDSQALVFAACMRDNGVDMPDPAPGQEGLVEAFQAVAADHDQATMEQAFVACQDVMPQYGQDRMHEEADVLELAECLREQGLEVSDNPFEDIHSGEIDQAELEAAMEVCRDALVGGGQ